MTAQSVGGSLEKPGYEEEVGMLEKWESVKGTIKTMGKELSAAFDWAFDRLFSRIQLTNEQFVYVLLSVVFIVANAILWVQKFQGFPITATERPEVVYKAKHRLIRFLIQRGSWRMETSSIMIWFI